MAVPDALGTQFQSFFIFSSDVRMMSASHPALYAPEEIFTSTCWIEGLHLVKNGYTNYMSLFYLGGNVKVVIRNSSRYINRG